MAQGEPQLEPAEAVKVPIAAEAAAAPLEPATAPPMAVPYGARAPDGLGGMRDVLAASTPTERRRFVLQLQRTAGNAAVCRWLGAVKERFAARHARDDRPREQPAAEDLELAALIADVEEILAGAGDDEPPDESDARPR